MFFNCFYKLCAYMLSTVFFKYDKVGDMNLIVI